MPLRVRNQTKFHPHRYQAPLLEEGRSEPAELRSRVDRASNRNRALLDHHS
jgi:hypothetical protein